MAEHNFQTFKQMNLWCNSHRICLSISSIGNSAVYELYTEFALVFQTKKCVTVIDLDFVFDNKTFREHLKKFLKSTHLFPLYIATFK